MRTLSAALIGIALHTQILLASPGFWGTYTSAEPDASPIIQVLTECHDAAQEVSINILGDDTRQIHAASLQLRNGKPAFMQLSGNMPYVAQVREMDSLSLTARGVSRMPIDPIMIGEHVAIEFTLDYVRGRDTHDGSSYSALLTYDNSLAGYRKMQVFCNDHVFVNDLLGI